MILEVVHIRTLVVLGRHRLGPAICWLRLRPTSWHERERTLVIECQRWTKPPESTSLLLAEVVAASTAKLVAQLVCWIGSSVRGATQFNYDGGELSICSYSPVGDHTWAEMVLTAAKSVCQRHAKMQ